MSELKPLASLGPQLLARKGAARPAMRPAMTRLALQSRQLDQDDLGWNDMGDPAYPAPVPDLPAAVSIAPRRRKPAPQAKAQRQPAAAAGRRAAFTLRLEADRHLRLKLACMIKGCSAQALVTEALDRLLSEIPDMADLVAKVARSRS